MTEKETKIINWISKVSKIRPELNNFAICPFAARSKFKIIECQPNNIEPINGFDVIIFVLDNNLTLEQVRYWVDVCNDKYPEWKFFEDCKDYSTYINEIQTNNGEFNLILGQPKTKLRHFREQLAKTEYYTLWDKDYLKEILGEDMDILGTVDKASI